MYYVVYLLQPEQNVVIPINWVQDIDKQWEKFVNYGLNSTQKYMCYWSNEKEAVDENGMPNSAFKANFHTGQSVNQFPEPGCYIGRILKFKREYLTNICNSNCLQCMAFISAQKNIKMP